MDIKLNFVSATLKPEAVALDACLPDDAEDPSFDLHRAWFGTDSPKAKGRPPVSPDAPRPRRTMSVLLQELEQQNQEAMGNHS
eukprot:CAMPEP_0114655736 /NCGR_PEP_ID=MMETSP0191-20121206/11364_1 /TAXON_ID=126664 /ORGANISM="Sorites sp." /LENGTH=82 /DNA_ID=CAMNT_0001871693 /DNA_START=40 /DNA_END=288 /DNA_ORIENTATION=-